MSCIAGSTCSLVCTSRAVCEGHDAPFDYLCHAYFEPTRDVVVWAPRGGGKTRLAALATLLDLLHKPTISIRILGGSLEQSLKMWEHLLPDLEMQCADLVVKPSRASSRRIELINGAVAGVLTQSQRAVRGLRVQKLRCDEVEMFDPDIWEAAQLATKSRATNSRVHTKVSGAVEALSTLHTPYGLMNRVVENAQRQGTRVIRWCLLDVLERCPAERECASCPLWDECRGIAKTRSEGFVSIDDAIAMKKRVSLETWNAEMLCRKPSVSGCVFPTFDFATHVREGGWEVVGGGLEEKRAARLASLSNPQPTTPNPPLSLAIDFGFANPFVCLWIASNGSATYVIDEYIQPMRTMNEHLEHIAARPWPKTKRIVCDPAGAGRNDQTAMSNIQVLRSAGYTVRSRRSLIVEGLEHIRAALKPASGPPTLFIHPRCTRLIRAMQSYRYPPAGGELPLKDGEHDHPIDALRYYFVNENWHEAVKVVAY